MSFHSTGGEHCKNLWLCRGITSFYTVLKLIHNVLYDEKNYLVFAREPYAINTLTTALLSESPMLLSEFFGSWVLFISQYSEKTKGALDLDTG